MYGVCWFVKYFKQFYTPGLLQSLCGYKKGVGITVFEMSVSY